MSSENQFCIYFEKRYQTQYAFQNPAKCYTELQFLYALCRVVQRGL